MNWRSLLPVDDPPSRIKTIVDIVGWIITVAFGLFVLVSFLALLAVIH